MKNLIVLIALISMPSMYGFSQEIEIVNPDDCISINKVATKDILGVKYISVDVKNECDKRLIVTLWSTGADGSKTEKCCIIISPGETNSSNSVESATGKITWEVTKIYD